MRKNLSSNNSITFTKVGKLYMPQGDVALKNVNLTIGKGEFVSIIGPSGCGKSSVLRIIAGIESPTSGTVIAPRTVSMVFQSGALLPWLTVYDNVALPLRAHHSNEIKIKRECREHIGMMGLEEYAYKYPRDLSGGQRQRVGIARALTINPDVILLDEPFSALDPKTTDELHRDILALWNATKKTIVLVSHLIEEAVSLSQRVIVMKNYTIVAEFSITLPYPRRDQEADFSRKVLEIRKVFFK